MLALFGKYKKPVAVVNIKHNKRLDPEIIPVELFLRNLTMHLHFTFAP